MQTTTDGNGEFSFFGNFPAGQYTISVASPSGYLSVGDQVVTVVEGEVTQVPTFTVAPLWGRIQGRVIDLKTGKPLVGVLVTATLVSDPVGQLIYEWFGPPFRSGQEYGWGPPWGRHEDRLATNPSFDWTEGAKPTNWSSPPPGYTALSGWGQVVEPIGGLGPTRNFRVHVRWERLYALAGGSWQLVESTEQYGIQGGWYYNSDFSAASGYVTWRQEAEGGFSVSWQTAPANTLLHWWIASWPHPLIPDGSTAFYSVAQLRLIPDTDPNVDLSAVAVYGAVGGDYFSSPTGSGGPGTGIPRHKRLTSQWKTFASATIPISVPPSNDPNYDYDTAVRSFSPMPPLFY